MSPNVPVPPPPPPPGGVPGTAGTRDGAQHTVTYPPAPAAQAGPPPSYTPTSGPTSRVAAPHAAPADAQPTMVAPASAFQPATVQHVTPVTQLPTAAQPAVPAPTSYPAPPQRVRYATEQNGFATAAPVGSSASRPSYAAEHAPNGYAAPAATYPGQPQAAQPAYHPPAAVAATPPTGATPGSGGGSGTSRPPAGRGAGDGGGRRGGRGSDRLSPGWIAFIVVDALLVIGAVVFAISLLGGGDEDPAAQGTTPPAATATEGTGETPDAEPTVSETFASESRNITCEVTDVGVTCEIAQLATQPAPVDGCEGTQGYRVVLDDSGVSTPCVPAAEQPQPAAADVAILAYGSSKTVGGYTCDSAETGMTCRDDATGEGFTIARAGIRPL